MPQSGSSNKLTIELVDQAGDWPDLSVINTVVEDALATTIVVADLQILPQAEICIVLSDDDHVRKLNHQWREIDKPTNVLSFPAEDIAPGEMPGLLLGDIVLAHETIAREAREFGTSFNDHLSHLVIHGFLHIFGYDHINDHDAVEMEELERNCLGKLGIKDPFDD